MAELQISILSPAKVVAKVTAGSVQLPGSLGYLGILPGHTRFVSELGIGELTVEGAGSGKQIFFVAGGYVDVASDQVTVLADVVEKSGDIDVKHAEAARQQALDMLAARTGPDYREAQDALAMAEARLAVAQHTRS